MEPRPGRSDMLTVVSVALLAYMLGTVIHEGLGHGVACLASRGTPVLISTVNVDCTADNRFVMAAGTIANVIAALIFFALQRRAASAWRYFFWFAMTINLFAAAGYFFFSGVGGFGDWAEFIQGPGPQLPWRIGIAVFGAISYMLVAWFSLFEMRPLIGTDKKLRYARAVELTRIPYFAGGTLACIAGALNPGGWILVALSAAAASFGGSSGLLWMTQWFRGPRIQSGSGPEFSPIQRSRGWIITAGIGACLFIGVLGPGLRFAR